MSDSVRAVESVFQFARWPMFRRTSREQRLLGALGALEAAIKREKALLREKSDLLQHQDLLAQEFEHRLMNSLQLIVNMLSLQSRGASPTAAAPLAVAAKCLTAFGREI